MRTKSEDKVLFSWPDIFKFGSIYFIYSSAWNFFVVKVNFLFLFCNKLVKATVWMVSAEGIWVSCLKHYLDTIFLLSLNHLFVFQNEWQPFCTFEQYLKTYQFSFLNFLGILLLLSSFYGLISIISVIGNTLVIFVVATSKSMQV